jgi:hypothetical protein
VISVTDILQIRGAGQGSSALRLAIDQSACCQIELYEFAD